MSKYANLANHLQGQKSERLRLTFADIELLIGDSLPESARKYDAWWANSRTADSHTWAHLWLRAGWEKTAVSFSEGWVEFRRVEFFDFDSPLALEGYEKDQKILARARKAEERRRRDNYSCQACGFRLQIGMRFVIEVHHRNPLAESGETETSIEDLVSLCPTCHRIAHLRSTPYDVEEIREIRTEPEPNPALRRRTAGADDTGRVAFRDP